MEESLVKSTGAALPIKTRLSATHDRLAGEKTMSSTDLQVGRLRMRCVNLMSFVLSAAAMITATFAARGPAPGRTLAQLYMSHPNLLSPSEWNLWIWLPLQMLCGVLALYQFFSRAAQGGRLRNLFHKLDPWFAITNLLTASWALTVVWDNEDGAIDAWVGVVLLLLLECCLVAVCYRLRLWYDVRSRKIEYVFVDLYFSCYASWIATSLCSQLAAAIVAARANVTAGWACAVLGTVACAFLLLSTRREDPASALVFCWAAAGQSRTCQSRSQSLSLPVPLSLRVAFLSVLAGRGHNRDRCSPQLRGSLPKEHCRVSGGSVGCVDAGGSRLRSQLAHGGARRRAVC